MAFQFTNLAQSTLDGAINDSVTTLDVVSAASFPTTGDFWINIEGEILKVTGVSSNTFTVVRGETGGTAAASHSSGVAVIAVVTAQAITQLRADMTRWGTYATMAALTDMKSGDVFHFDGTDTPYTKAIYNGSSWDLYYQGRKCTPFVPGDFSWVNQGPASYSSYGGATVLTTTKVTNSIRCLVKAQPSTPYTITVLFQNYEPDAGGGNAWAGPLWRESGSGEIHTATIQDSSFDSRRWDSPTSANATYSAVSTLFRGPLFMMRITRNSGRKIEIADNPVAPSVWIQFDSQTDTDFLDANQVGFHIHNNSSGSSVSYATILSWEQS